LETNHLFIICIPSPTIHISNNKQDFFKFYYLYIFWFLLIENESVAMGIFSDIPSDPEEEEVEDHFQQTTDPTFTDFRLIKADGKET